jgi:beta-glucuronidase
MALFDRPLSRGDRRVSRRNTRSGQQRWLDIDVRKEMAMDNRTMFEFDMAHSLTTALPGSWLAASPELRHYQGVVWYQRHFDAPSNRKGRYFLRFGAANYATTAYLNGKPLGRHEGGFTPFAFEVTQRCAMVIIRSPCCRFTGNAHHRSAHRHRLGKLRRRHARHSVGPHACHLCRQCDGPPDHGWQAGGRGASRWRGGGGAELRCKIAGLKLDIPGKTDAQGNWKATIPRRARWCAGRRKIPSFMMSP